MDLKLRIKETTKVKTITIKNVAHYFRDKAYLTVTTQSQDKQLFKLTTILSIKERR